MNEKANNRAEILSYLIISLLVIQSFLIILLLRSLSDLKLQINQFLLSGKISEISPASTLVGHSYIDFELPDTNGDVFRLSEQIRQPSLLVFSNHECQACQNMYPELLSYAKNHPEMVIIIITSNTMEQNIEFMSALTNDYPNIHTLLGSQKIFDLYGVNATPTFFAINSDGIIVDSASVMTEKEIVDHMKGTS
jgi:peroxiredoxin